MAMLLAGTRCAAAHGRAQAMASSPTDNAVGAEDTGKLPDVQAQLHDQLGMNIVGSKPKELLAHMDNAIPHWADLVKKSGATPD